MRVLVRMVDNRAGWQEAPQVRLEYKAMLKDVARFPCRRVHRSPHKDVAVLVEHPPSCPVWMTPAGSRTCARGLKTQPTGSPLNGRRMKSERFGDLLLGLTKAQKALDLCLICLLGSRLRESNAASLAVSNHRLVGEAETGRNILGLLSRLAPTNFCFMVGNLRCSSHAITLH